MNDTPDNLLATDEPPPFTVGNENGTSPLLIVADHAGKHFPRRLGQLGLSNAEGERHIAWDIGVGAVCCLIGKALDAVVVRQNYSRLVIDCNRTPGSGTSILDLSELTRVQGNIGLERVSIRLNRKRALASLVGRIFCGKPVSTFPENALRRGDRNNLDPSRQPVDSN